MSAGAIMSKYGYDGMAYSGYLLTRDDEVDGFSIRFRRTDSPVIQTLMLVSDAFNHVVVTFDGVTQLAYINAEEECSDHAPASIQTARTRFGEAAASKALRAARLTATAEADSRRATVPSALTTKS